MATDKKSFDAHIKCVGTDKLPREIITKPLVSILMAVYNPNVDWLTQQLKSLNDQTYENLELIVLDDCSPDVAHEEIKRILEDTITDISFEIHRNDENQGSNKTFEKLTLLAKGAYIAYCDQDDVWCEEKIETLVAVIEKSRAVLAYSDMTVIDGNGRETAKSLRDIRPRLKYVQGSNLTDNYIFENCTAGCTMIVQSNIAKMAVPFQEHTVFDQWICIIAANRGNIAFVDRQLLKYRQHETNQTGILQGVTDKKGYYAYKTAPMYSRVSYLRNITDLNPDSIAFAEARKNKKIFGIWKYRNFCRKDAMFEMALALLPELAAKVLIKKVK